MDVHISEVVSTVRAVDGQALLSPQVLEGIVRAVLRAVEEGEAHRQRVEMEQRMTRGVRPEAEEE